MISATIVAFLAVQGVPAQGSPPRLTLPSYYWAKAIIAGNLGPTYVCVKGSPRDCFPIAPPWIWRNTTLRPSNGLSGPTAELNETTSNLRTGEGKHVAYVSINSQLMIVGIGRGEADKAAPGRSLPLGEVMEAFGIDRGSMVRRESGAGICFGLSGGNVYQVPGKTTCLFPAKLLSSTGRSALQDKAMTEATNRINSMLAKVAQSNKDAGQELAIAMLEGRPLLVWVTKGSAPGRVMHAEDNVSEATRVLGIE